jgi:hypothetical protein
MAGPRVTTYPESCTTARGLGVPETEADLAARQLRSGSLSNTSTRSLGNWLIEPGEARPRPSRRTRDALDANVSSNRNAPGATLERWLPAARSLWAVLAPIIPVGGRVAIVGAGNCYDLPLEAIARRAGRVDLIDIDHEAVRGGIARLPEDLRDHIEILIEDITGGAADDIVAAMRDWHEPLGLGVPATPLGEGNYDVVVGDLIYGQLLGPGLRRAGVPESVLIRALDMHAPGLVSGVVARMHASAPEGRVVHIHDLICWSAAWEHAHTLEAVLHDPDSTLNDLGGAWLIDPCRLLDDTTAQAESIHYWHWPFLPGSDYLVRTVVARSV